MTRQPFSSAETPLDRALTLSISGESEGALQWAAGLVKLGAGNETALLVASRHLGELGRREAAVTGLETCVTRSIDAAHLALAVTACRELEALGTDAAPRLDAIAQTFGKGSKRLLEEGAAPPPAFADKPLDFAALTSAGDALLDEAAAIVEKARADLERAADEREAPPKVPPQPLFSTLEPKALRAVISGFIVKFVGSGDVLVEEGTEGSEAYVVARGELEVQRNAGDGKDPIRLARLGADSLFGEMALLSRAPRAASVVAARPSIVLVETREALDGIVEKEPTVGNAFAGFCHRRMVDNLVRTSSILRALRSKERHELIDRFVTKTFEKNAKIIKQGEESSGLHLVASGEVGVVHHEGGEDTVIATLGPGEVVGEVSLVLRRPSNADVVADTPTVTLHLPRDEFMKVIKEHPTLLAELYELAVQRDEETTSVVAQEATDADDLILL